MEQRLSYLANMEKFKNAPVIKVLTGMRRAGKSTLLKLFCAKIMENGVLPEDIIFIDMENFDFSHIKTAKDLNNYVKEKLREKQKSTSDAQAGKCFLFIDEVQDVGEWERAVASFLNSGQFDIYITGSNANLLSSELATKLTGRYVEIPVYPLTYGEFVQFRGAVASEELFREFLQWGGMPGIHHIERDENVVQQYLGAVLDSVFLKDVVQRFQIRDVDLLRRVFRFVVANTGKTFSANSVVNYLKKEKRTVSAETIYNYIAHLQSAFLVYKVPRYDVKGKRHLEVSEKLYCADLGILRAFCGSLNDIGAALECVVYFELKKRGYEVSVGKIGDAEIDFIAERAGKRMYIQVCYLLASEDVTKREFASLIAVPDHFPKVVLSMDKIWGTHPSGVERLYLPDFLLNV
jgi:predicted AAA+ superfamily ATPase